MAIIFQPPQPSRNQRYSDVSFRVNLKVPFAEKDQAKKLGARWDKELKLWYVMLDRTKSIVSFKKWLKLEDQKLIEAYCR